MCQCGSGRSQWVCPGRYTGDRFYPNEAAVRDDVVEWRKIDLSNILDQESILSRTISRGL
jgi:hypothetical protein